MLPGISGRRRDTLYNNRKKNVNTKKYRTSGPAGKITGNTETGSFRLVRFVIQGKPFYIFRDKGTVFL
jgi:hypothetical protein